MERTSCAPIGWDTSFYSTVIIQVKYLSCMVRSFVRTLFSDDIPTAALY